MDRCKYEEVRNADIDHKPLFWTPLLKQLFICSGVWTISFSMGLCLGAPTVYIPQMRREANSTDVITDEMASWLYSIFGYAAIPWIIVIAISMHYFGRRLTFTFVSLNTTFMFVLFYFSRTLKYLIITEILQGAVNGSTLTISLVILAEYTSPRSRRIFLPLKTASIFWGVWVSNAIGTFFHWTYIPLTGFCISLYSLTVFCWCESPYWLASKRRYSDCQNVHRWLKGTDEEIELELTKIIDTQIENDKGFKANNFKMYYTMEFFKPLMISSLMVSQYHLSGKFVINVYAIDIIKKITSSESAAYSGMLILDGVTVFAMYLGCFLSNYLKRRTLLFTFTLTSIVFLYIISLYLYLIKLKIIFESQLVTITLLTVISLSISAGPVLMATSTFGELTPMRFKSACMIIVTFIYHILQSTVVKVSPFLFKTIDLHGTFLTFSISVTICTILLYRYLPETKDKTLLEIEEYFKDHKRVISDQSY